MEKNRVLVVDDDKNICELLRMYIEKEGYEVSIANDGNSAVKFFEKRAFDIVLLDIMLPGMDGWQVCKEIRKIGRVPIIMLTAKDQVFDKVLGLELGADDYMVKPFNVREVVARVKAVLRRTRTQQETEALPEEINYDNLSINIVNNYTLKINGELVEMRPKEMELIYYLACNPNKIFTRGELMDRIWGYDSYGDSRTVDVHINRIRDKLEGVSDKWELRTVWGKGYKFETKE